MLVFAALLLISSVAERCFGQANGEAPRAGASQAQLAGVTADVSLELAEFGFGGLARPGGWVGLRVIVRDRAPQPRELLLRATLTDADGDSPEYQTVVAGADSTGRSAWVYVALPPSFGSASTIELSAFAIEGETAPGATPQAGRLLVREFIGPASMTDSRVTDNFAGLEEGLIAVLGTRTLGLRAYTPLDPNMLWLPLGHEPARLGLVPTAAHLPDRWLGLSQLDTLVWYNAELADVGPDDRRALIEWIRRGGHLVVVVGPSAQTWAIGPGNPLSDIMPRVRADRLERVGWEDYGALIARIDTDQSPRRQPAIHELSPIGSWDAREAVPILSDAEGRVLVARRVLGTGMVTQVGIDLGDPALGELPRADRFWNRVLGKSPETRTAAELNNMPPAVINSLRQRLPKWYDIDLTSEVSLTGRAAAGLLFGAVVFALYWLLAGPPGFGILKAKKWQRHAWVTFFGLAVVFTAIAWTAAWALRPKQVMAQHLTMIDHVFASSNQHARGWLGLLVPRYGEASLTVGSGNSTSSDSAVQRPFTDAAAPWEPRRSGGIGRFPDARGYPIASRRPDRMTFPVRSTVKQLVVDWAGQPIDGGAMPRPIGGGSTPADAAGPVLAVDSEGLPLGVLAHNLGDDLESVIIIVNPGQVAIGGDEGDVQRSWFGRAQAYSLPRWPDGTSIDLADIARQNIGNTTLLEAFLNDLVPNARGGLGAAGDENAPGSPEDRLAALALFDLLPLPTAGGELSILPVTRRWATHELDISRWLTQPCVIVIGHLRGSASPIPMQVNGSPLASRGRTVVRWIYPLAPEPPAWGEPAGRSADGSN